MFLKNTITAMRIPNPWGMIGLMRDWQSLVRIYFIYAAIESGLLTALKQPHTREELLHNLKVERPEILEALLDTGLSLGELACNNGTFRIKGKRSKMVIGPNGDMFAAVIQANMTYYHSVYQHAPERLMGAPSGNYLAEVGDVVARFAKLGEPFIRNFIKKIVAGRKSLRILEIGCGSGIFLRTALETNSNATGVGLDMDEDVVAQARQNLKAWGIDDKFEVICGDIRKPLPELTGKYDVITLYNIIYYFSVAERKALFQKLCSLMAENGALAIISNVQGNGKDLGASNLNMATTSFKGCTPLPALDEITALLKECGFKRTRKTRLIPRSAFYGITAA